MGDDGSLNSTAEKLKRIYQNGTQCQCDFWFSKNKTRKIKYCDGFKYAELCMIFFRSYHENIVMIKCILHQNMSARFFFSFTFVINFILNTK